MFAIHLLYNFNEGFLNLLIKFEFLDNWNLVSTKALFQLIKTPNENVETSFCSSNKYENSFY